MCPEGCSDAQHAIELLETIAHTKPPCTTYCCRCCSLAWPTTAALGVVVETSPLPAIAATTAAAPTAPAPVVEVAHTTQTAKGLDVNSTLQQKNNSSTQQRWA
jgi:hypothetical protein